VKEIAAMTAPDLPLKISLRTYPMAKISDDDELAMTLTAMYAAISFPEGGEPEWNRMNAVFHRSARFTRITPEGVDHFDLESFQAMAMEMLDRGVYTCFFEKEIARTAQVFGSFAHVLSAYETKRSPDAASYLTRGVNSIQLLRSGAATWQVLSLLWDEETTTAPLELTNLFEIGDISDGKNQ
jgi:hypothetical protein